MGCGSLGDSSSFDAGAVNREIISHKYVYSYFIDTKAQKWRKNPLLYIHEKLVYEYVCTYCTYYTIYIYYYPYNPTNTES